jgi:tetratricopeptide (TPR) repeat protein
MAAMPTAKAAAQRALELDERLAEAYVCRGATRLLFDYDWSGAEADLLHAVELRPELPLAHAWSAIYLCAMCRAEEAVQRVQRAAELDPLMLSIQSLVGLTYYFNRRFDEAIARHRALLSLDPSMVRVHVWVARSCFAAGRTAEGLAIAEDAIRRLGRRPTLLEQLGVGLASLGHTAEAEGVIKELDQLGEQRPLTAWHRAAIHRALHHDDEFRRSLEQLVPQRSGRIAFLAAEPSHDRVRSQPWFQALLRTLELPVEPIR